MSLWQEAHHRERAPDYFRDELSCCWHSADYKLSWRRPIGSRLDFASLSCILHASRHFACKNFAPENLTSHTPTHTRCLHSVGGSICSTQAAALPHLNGKYFVVAYTLHSGLNISDQKKYLCKFIIHITIKQFCVSFVILIRKLVIIYFNSSLLVENCIQQTILPITLCF